jgi:hypothetical protein
MKQVAFGYTELRIFLRTKNGSDVACHVRHCKCRPCGWGVKNASQMFVGVHSCYCGCFVIQMR